MVATREPWYGLNTALLICASSDLMPEERGSSKWRSF